MIQDIYPYKLRNEYQKNAKAEEKDLVIVFQLGTIMIGKTEIKKNTESIERKVVGPVEEKCVDGKQKIGLRFPTVKELGRNLEYTYLFSVDEERYFLLRQAVDAPEGFVYCSLNDIRNQKLGPKEKIFAIYTAKHLADWYRDTTFCGRCGKKMQHSQTERAMKCECGYTAYPRIMPAVIVGVKNGDKLLLTKYRTGYQHNALIAGFTEIGETVEETVAREVMEEAGIKVKNIQYYKSQPWGTANDILLGFYCDVDGDTEIHMDKEELKYAEWVKREDIVLQPDEFSLTNEMMSMFKNGKE